MPVKFEAKKKKFIKLQENEDRHKTALVKTASMILHLGF